MNFFYPTENLQRKPQPLFLTSSQDGGVDRHTAPPCTTKRRTTTNLKTKNTQNCQKIELYGSPTARELKKKHSSRLVGGAETGSWAESTCSKKATSRLGRARLRLADLERRRIADWVQINREEQLGSETDHTTQGPSTGK